MNILIYNDDGVGEVCTPALYQSLQDAGRAPDFVSAQDLPAALNNVDVFFMPGGADIPYLEKLAGEGVAAIKSFVQQGGVYVGICAGAYFACDRIVFEKGSRIEVIGDRPLKFIDGVGYGALYPYEYEDHNNGSVLPIRYRGEEYYSWYHGGCWFDPYEGADYEALAYFPTHDNKCAAVKTAIGKGAAILMGFHPEIAARAMHGHIDQDKEAFFKKQDAARHALWQKVLEEIAAAVHS